MTHTKTTFIRKYKRASKSIWDNDDSTILLLADIKGNDDGERAFNFTRYIYLHRDNVGNVLGISISKAMLDEHPDFSGRYLEGVEMFAMLLLYIDDITEFCTLFADEFERIFLLEPRDYFEAAELRWFSILGDA
ncbi:hypothetical protein [Psychrobium sp. 1_MG-2023]|uniref:hypothetical protein n=1 Tax=Psychrobium sp. 1_MG-2023 TaxID=3062624 RepID=UPI000C31CBF4|nr:hypothetical protein [Psychrobium sp. 1_MG-2023]MDP2561189.1 hypothetical protein [Psychrobium sp. 1_MG-2023]PKF55306.1 hypothetical protein CW748_13905 [Alteromonadales bacterium alter-6D02]